VFDLRKIASDHAAQLQLGTLAAVQADRRVITAGGDELAYDALVVAVGARPTSWLTGAVHFRGPEDVERIRALVSGLDAGDINSLVFTSPARAAWTLPMYELALLTASHLSERGGADAQLTIVTPEQEPLAMFGPAASKHVRDLCSDRGIRLRTAAAATSFDRGRLEIDPSASVEADAVVALPALEGHPIGGLPRDAEGFIPVDEHCAVEGLEHVFAAGDGIAYPIKQGGLATQQADTAARAIAAGLGAEVEPHPFSPCLRGQLLTGLGPTYLRATPEPEGVGAQALALNPLWWPPSKIAGRYLAPYLASRGSHIGTRELEERDPVPGADPEASEEARRLALAFAEHDAQYGDYRSALGWLDTVEQIDGVLSPAVIEKRSAWRARGAEP
jgi:sulfide:quinone oxidoreductase